MIKTKSIYRSKERKDGKRILISRLHPRGIKKSHYDEWLKELSPSIELVHEYKNGKITWKKFLSNYKSEISKNSQSLDLIEHLRKQSKTEDITLLCFEPDGEPCHRHVLREIIKKTSFLANYAIPKFEDKWFSVLPLLCKNILPRSFYDRETTVVAKKLLGKQLVRVMDNKIISGMIVETEAYRSDDPASHTYTGMTERNKAMFSTVGCAYIYTTHGIHSCIDVVARSKRFQAGGVLIRALHPDIGIDIMEKNRQTHNFKNLTNGPAKLTQALQIDKKLYGIDLTIHADLFITEGISTKNKIQSTPRIGIKKATEKLWNFKLIF